MKKLIIIILVMQNTFVFAQTDIDGLMMEKKLFCVGVTAGKSTWKNYWEGTMKRENLNLGKVSTSNIMLMGNYGITDKLNVLFGMPYIATKASAGQLSGQKGIQDLSLFAKWVGYEKQSKKGTLKGIVIIGLSTPLTNYTPDLLPLSIGLKSKTSQIKLMTDYQYTHWTATLSGAYIFRNNVTLDRNTYYTTEMHYTNEVFMPNATNFNLRFGYRSDVWIAEATINQWNTLGGFDITRNNMPFVSNKMNATTCGLNIKYETNFINGLSFIINGSSTIKGRNIGQNNGLNIGAFYIMNFSSNKKQISKKNEAVKSAKK